MIFNSFSYLIFFPVVTLLYFVLPRKIRWVWLLVSSYYFYMNWHAEYALLMAASTLVTYICALAVSRVAKPKARKAVLVGGIVFNLGMLGYFKYTGMFIDILNRVCGALGFALRLPQVDILLPLRYLTLWAAIRTARSKPSSAAPSQSRGGSRRRKS